MLLAVVFLVVLAFGLGAALLIDLRGRTRPRDVDADALRRSKHEGLKHEPPAPPAGMGGFGV